MPPAQPLNQPQDGDILYDTSDYAHETRGIEHAKLESKSHLRRSYQLFMTNSWSTVVFDSTTIER